MRLNKTTVLGQKERVQIVSIWNTVYPKNLKYDRSDKFDSYLENLIEPFHYLVYNDEDQIIAWLCVFMRQEEKWFVMLIEEKHQGMGLGSFLLDKVKEEETLLNGWVVDHNQYKKCDGDCYCTPLGFYQKKGFEAQPDTRFENKSLSAVKITWNKNITLKKTLLSKNPTVNHSKDARIAAAKA